MRFNKFYREEIWIIGGFCEYLQFLNGLGGDLGRTLVKRLARDALQVGTDVYALENNTLCSA